MALTAKMKRFAEEYIVDLNAAQAAIRAGYSVKTAKQIGQENLTKPDLQNYVNQLMQERSQRTEITADMVLQEYAKIGFSNITDYLSVEDKLVTVDRDGEGRPITELAQVVNIFDTDMVREDKMRAVAEIKQTKDGIALKLHDKKGALDSIARHLGMFNDNLNLKGGLNNTNQEITQLSPDERRVRIDELNRRRGIGTT